MGMIMIDFGGHFNTPTGHNSVRGSSWSLHTAECGFLFLVLSRSDNSVVLHDRLSKPIQIAMANTSDLCRMKIRIGSPTLHYFTAMLCVLCNYRTQSVNKSFCLLFDNKGNLSSWSQSAHWEPGGRRKDKLNKKYVKYKNEGWGYSYI